MNIKYHLLALLATTLVAGSFIASEKLAGIVNPFYLTLFRFLGASLILLPVVFSKTRWRRKILPTMPRALVISLFYSVFFITLFESLKTTTPLSTGALFTLVPLITALLSIPAFKENISKQQIIVYFLGAAGAFWVVSGGQLELPSSLNKGDLIFMVGALSMCCYSITMKFLYRNDENIVLVFCTLLGGSFWLTIALLFINQPIHWDLIKGPSILHMAYLIIGSTLVTVYLYQKTTVILGSDRVSAYIYLIPSLVAILLFLVDQVSIPMAIIPGILISSAATIVLQSKSRPVTAQRSY